MKHLIFLLLVLSPQLWAARNSDIDIKKLENQRAFIGQLNQCVNPNQLDEFIKKAIQNTSDYETRSKYAGVLEELIKYNPSCFIASINKLDNINCRQIEDAYINEPHFYPREDLRNSLRKTKDFSKSCLAV